MTREEAIKILEENARQNKVMRDNPNTFFRSSDMPDGIKNAKQRIEALDMAVSALRAQPSPAKLDRSRWEGCKFCAREIYIKTTQYLRPALAPATHVEELRYRLADLTGEVYLEAPKKYCWFCGHPLTEEAWAELERRIGGNDGKTDI